MRFLIAGFGSIGRRHLRNLLALGEKDIHLFRSYKSTLPISEAESFPVYSDLQEALSQKPDAVIIANPTSMHLDIAFPAIEAGCHLLIEKPLSDNNERIAELEQAVDASGVKILMGFQFRYHPGLKEIKRLLETGQIGRLVSLRTHWGEFLPDWHPWEDYRKSYSAQANLGGGVILTLCHPLDYLRWLVGEITTLWAFTAKLSDLDIDVEDTAEIGFRFSSGVLGSLHLCYNQRPATHRIELIGTEGTITWDYSDGGVNIYDIESGRWEKSPLEGGFERNDMFLSEMDHFLSVIRGSENPRCSLSDGIKALELALAAKRSADQAEIVHFD